MTPELAVLTRLKGLAPVTAIVAQRVYMLHLPQSPTYPAIRVVRISGVWDQQLKGPDGVTESRVQVDAYEAERPGADAYTTVSTLADAIRGNGCGPTATGLWGWTGTVAGVRVFNMRLEDSGADYEGDELRLVRIRQDFLLAWR